MTDRYDPKNPQHVEIKKGIELGDGIEDGALAEFPETFAYRG